ncbi:hypothetical protein BB559_001130 [Furculomyces boomerangus]|uniref:BRCT domain-containing protein n=2 Tax=Harpellales TaxID=61421 RepID=A0A2T9Z2Z3_9FUNG|nr:hypothetical protein BB559_001130 [Furculomyces boomerangus]PWA01832.1 hypothetical protein BB558_002041 [Smittium angustum]
MPGNSLFSNTIAWFEEHVPKHHVSLWIANGGLATSDMNEPNIDYFFCCSVTSIDIFREIKSLDRIAISSLWIIKCVVRATRIPYNHYIFDINEETNSVTTGTVDYQRNIYKNKPIERNSFGRVEGTLLQENGIKRNIASPNSNFNNLSKRRKTTIDSINNNNLYESGPTPRLKASTSLNKEHSFDRILTDYSTNPKQALYNNILNNNTGNKRNLNTRTSDRNSYNNNLAKTDHFTTPSFVSQKSQSIGTFNTKMFPGTYMQSGLQKLDRLDTLSTISMLSSKYSYSSRRTSRLSLTKRVFKTDEASRNEYLKNVTDFVPNKNGFVVYKLPFNSTN